MEENRGTELTPPIINENHSAGTIQRKPFSAKKFALWLGLLGTISQLLFLYLSSLNNSPFRFTIEELKLILIFTFSFWSIGIGLWKKIIEERIITSIWTGGLVGLCSGVFGASAAWIITITDWNSGVFQLIYYFFRHFTFDFIEAWFVLGCYVPALAGTLLGIAFQWKAIRN